MRTNKRNHIFDLIWIQLADDAQCSKVSALLQNIIPDFRILFFKLHQSIDCVARSVLVIV